MFDQRRMERLLYIDESIERASEITKLFDDLYQIEHVVNGWNGLGACLTCEPNIIIMHREAPIVDAAEFVRLARQEPSLQTIPILYFLSQTTSIEHPPLTTENTFSLSYPFVKKDILALITTPTKS